MIVGVTGFLAVGSEIGDCDPRQANLNFDDDADEDRFRSVLWRINVDADDQGRGVGRFAVEKLLDEARSRGMDRVDVIYEAGQGGPEQFFTRVGFVPVDETEYGEVVAEIRL